MGANRYRNGFEVTLHSDLVDLPKRWREPRLIFVNSMSDLFHERVPLEFIRSVFATMRDCPQHTFQILTKRSSRLREAAPELDWTANVWMGVSVEDARVLQRVYDLQTVPAAVRFLSCEPLIGPINDLPLEGIHWVIVGGESGARARPFDLEWARGIVAQCRDANVPVFVKQMGSRPIQFRVHGKGGDMSEWPEDLRIRDRPRRTPTNGDRVLLRLEAI